MPPQEPTQSLHNPIHIRGARVVPGRGRGKTIGIPTINVELSSVPPEMHRGIYASRITLGDRTYSGALHYGLRPAFNDTETMEIHVIDQNIAVVPPTVDLEIIALLRGVEDFPDVESLLEAIRGDIDVARAILETDDSLS